MRSKTILTLLFVIGGILLLQKGYGQLPAIDSFLKLNGADRYYELYHIYGNVIKNKASLDSLNNLVDAYGDESDRLVQYYWLEKRPILDSIKYGAQNISIHQELVKKAEAIPNYYLAAHYYISMVVVYNALNDYNKAFESQLLCLEALEKDPDGRYFEQCWWLHILANKYYEFKDYSKAAFLATKASTLNLKYTPDGVWFKKVNNNLVGMAYLRNAQYDSAVVWLSKTYQQAELEKDTTWMGIAWGNIGTVDYLQNNCKAAIIKYSKALVWCRQKAMWDNVASFCNNLAHCYLQEGNLNAIPGLLQESELANKKDINHASFVANQVKLFSVAEEYYRKIGNNEKAIRYGDSVKKYQTLYTNYFDIAKKIKSEGEFAYQSKDLQNKILLQENQLQKRTLIFTFIAILLTVVFIVYYIKRANLRKKLAEKNRELLEKQLANSKKEIRTFTDHILEKNQLIETYLAEIITLKKHTQAEEQENLLTIQELKTNTILTNDDWVKFKTLFEQVYPDFFPECKRNYPDLTQAEIRFLAFTKLEITPREMASLLGVSDEAIRTLRYRIKKKLTLADGKDIEQVVANM